MGETKKMQKRSKWQQTKLEMKKYRMSYVMIAPYFILFFLFTVLPVLASIGISFTDFNMLETPNFVGWRNYIKLLLDDDVFKKAFTSDIFITSTNALTMDGCLYNIDGTGNRVAAMIFGPREVIVIAGLNKICQNEEEAIARIRHCSAPANAIRLNKKTPCTKTGHCMDCHSPDRICSSYVKLAYQKQVNRIKVIIVEENLGY